MTTSSSSTLSGPPRLHLRSPADIAEAVPYLVGFHPQESVVLLSLRGHRGLVGLVMRSDLPPDDELGAFAEGAVDRLRRDGARRAVLVVYPGSGVQPGPDAHRPLVKALQQQLIRGGLSLFQALCVGDGRWWSYTCTGRSCCPPEGVAMRARGPDAPASELSAAATFAGMTALPDRQALADTLRPVDADAAARLRREFERGLERLGLPWPGHGRNGDPAPPAGAVPAERAAESVALLHAAVGRFGRGDRELTDREVARLVLGLQDLPVRDVALTWICDDEGDAASALWQELARRSVPPFDLVPLTLVAWTALSRGQGALARIAIELARGRDPGYQLAALIEEAVEQGVHPRELRRLALLRHRSRCSPDEST